MTAVQDTLPPVAPEPGTGEKTPQMSTSGLLTALKTHYRKPGTARDGCILITEPESPGPQRRRCDLIHIGVASRGRGIDAHELKVSRSDWLRELDDPAKADAWWPYCSRWWVVAPPGIIRGGELPAGWGLMEPQSRSRRFRVVAEAAVKEPQLTLGLLADLLARADNERLAEIEALRQEHRDDLYQQAQKIRAEQEVRGLSSHTRDRLDALKVIEEAAGVKVDQYAWHGETPVTAVRPEEFAAALPGVAGHVAAQRLLADARRIRDALAKAAQRALTQLEAAP
jgi:hypothetical protein